MRDWLTDGGEVISLTCRPASLYLYSFLFEAESTPGPNPMPLSGFVSAVG
jgi:hypothetical protein